jgi:hypothetical protein
MATGVQADFNLTGNQHMDVTETHYNGYLWNTSSADVFSKLYNAYVNDEAILRVMGGRVVTAYAYDNSSVNVSGGEISLNLNAYDTSTINITDGVVYGFHSYNSSTATISGGLVWTQSAHGTSTINITDGRNDGLYAFDNSVINISGGIMNNYIYASGSSTINISGGSIGGVLHSIETSNITFYGQHFVLGGGLSLYGNELIGTGTLSGQWFDGTSWTTQITTNDTTATILIPEPASLLLLALGGLLIRKR